MKQKEVWNSLYRKNLRWKFETQSLPKVFKGKKVLELGAGNGKTIKSILSQKPKELLALDFSNVSLDIIKKEFPTIRCVEANLTSMPFKENSLDFVICYYTLNNLLKEGRDIVITEIYRILKNKGFCIFEDFAVGDFREFSSDKKIEPHTFEKTDGLICHFFDEKEAKELFKKFSSVNCKIKRSSPITHRPNLQRILISVVAKK